MSDPNDNLKKIFKKAGMYSDKDAFKNLFDGLFKPQIVTCQGCQQKNRVDSTKVDQKPRCGKCGLPFPVAK